MEQGGLTELFQAYSNDVFRLAYSYLGNRSSAEDVCQEVFLKLTDGRRTKPEAGKEKAWLLICTANACKNQLRSFWHRNVEKLDEAIPFKESRDSEIHQVVMSLPSKYRAVIHLYYFEGYSQAEIGNILHISLTSVQTRMSRARTLLKRELSNDEIKL